MIERTAPEPFGSLIDDVCAKDREWFEGHPFATERTRPMVPGELWPLRYPDGARVRVAKLAPGVRTRAPLTAPAGTYDVDEAAILAEHVNELPADWEPLLRGGDTPS